ncbi:MAG: AmmeMemoRadiSam system protein B [Candidatus Omnitrophica bacterium]|nr:AmmeMemoRadiSam system protein B [Candidatus Omnitrophota bacterium]
MTREPVVAGQFYPGGKDNLLRDLSEMIPDRKDKIDAIGAIVPHAGYMCSGFVAGEVYGKLKQKDTYIILGPNHTGHGSQFASCKESWLTPLGTVDIDIEMLDAMMRETDLITDDESAHAFEHSIEVQVPFVQKTAPSAKIVPVTVQNGTLPELEEVSEAIVSAMKGAPGSAMILASSDMTHYEPRNAAEKKDKLAIQKVIDIDPEGLLKVVMENSISMCGCIPSAIMLMCAKKMNALKSELVKYSDSGDATGDTSSVVGYAGMVVY